MIAQDLTLILLTICVTSALCYLVSGPRRLSRTLCGTALKEWERVDPWERARFAVISRRGNITYLTLAAFICLLAMIPWWVITGM